MQRLPLEQRRAVLEQAIAKIRDPIRLSGGVSSEPADLITAGKKQRIEGFVAKRRGSTYEPGRRSGAWVKYKINQGQELVWTFKTYRF